MFSNCLLEKGGSMMELKQKLQNVVDFYYDNVTLKNCERSGWKQWKILRNKRVESIAEHVFGAQQLAIAMYSEFDIPVDIQKVLTMLSIHETEEIEIGDITCCDGVSAEKKLEIGSIAVNDVYKNMQKKSKFISLIDEFNARETSEAKFAYCCDKMECDLMAKIYSDDNRLSINNCLPHVANDKCVKKYIAAGTKTVADVFHVNDRDKFDEIPEFKELFNFIISKCAAEICKKI
jgi:5'-deoxynucleotidase YfbR-like HD superfamily hydrolase